MNRRQRVSAPAVGPWRAIQSLLLLVAVLMTSGRALAATTINLSSCPAAEIGIPGVVGSAISGENIGVAGASGNVTWDFSSTAGWTVSGDHMSRDGVTITLPAVPPAAVANSAVVTVGGSPTASGTFQFGLIVAADPSGTPSCTVSFAIEVSKPFQLGFVLDTSGSMNTVVSGSTTRWSALRTAVNGFTPSVETRPNGGEFALTFFSSSASNPSGFGSLVAVNSSLSDNVNAVMGLTPGGSTAMGQGLQNSVAKLTGTNKCKAIVLFTDGIQNVAPLVNDTGTGYVGGGNIQPGGDPIKIVTVAVNSPSGSDLTRLQDIASHNGGVSIFTDNGSTFSGGIGIDEAFTNAIAPALSCGSPQAVARFSGTAPAEAPAVLDPFEIDTTARTLLLNVTLDGEFKKEELRQFLATAKITKDGTDISSRFSQIVVGTTTNIGTLYANFQDPQKGLLAGAGKYVVALRLRGHAYKVLVLADDHAQGMKWSVEPALPRVGQTFNPTLELSFRGAPITNATAQAVVLRPGEDLGDLLALDPKIVDPQTGPDPMSAGYQKYLWLLQNDPTFLAKLKGSNQNLTLAHQANGKYTASFDPGDVSGVHQVLYVISADDPKFGKLQRIAFQSVYVRFGEVDMANTAYGNSLDTGGVVLSVRPVTKPPRAGLKSRFIGPAQGDAFKVAGTGITLTKVVDKQNGGYDLHLTGDPNATITLSLLGDTIYQGKASDFSGSTVGDQGTQRPIWHWFLVILLVFLLIVFLVWLIRRLKGTT